MQIVACSKRLIPFPIPIPSSCSSLFDLCAVCVVRAAETDVAHYLPLLGSSTCPCLHKILRIRHRRRHTRTHTHAPAAWVFGLCPFAFLRHNARLSGHNVCPSGSVPVQLPVCFRVCSGLILIPRRICWARIVAELCHGPAGRLLIFILFFFVYCCCSFLSLSLFSLSVLSLPTVRAW